MAKHGVWMVVALVGALSLAVIASARGEAINALWLIAASGAVYLIAYRYYSRFIADRVLGIDPSRPTPAHTRNDGLDYVPTNRHVLFGHHFAAIAGAGPLVGPVLAAQMGYLPGMLWILFGVVLAGAVQDFIILFISMRRDGRSLGELVRMEMGPVAGVIALFGAFLIMLIILAVLALIVVRALAESPWGLFTVMATIPLAMLMGLYLRFIRPGRVGEVSVVGFVGLILAIVFGQNVAASPVWGPIFTLTPTQLAWGLIGYGAVAAVLPVWLLLAPRDYLSTFLKIGAIAALAIGMVIVAPELRMPAFSRFANGGGPVWSGSMFPFLFITIACGAVSGFHSLISSGTTPKLIATEGDARFIGYGAMLMESAVAMMALISASILDPGVYFTMNSPAAVIGTTAESAAAAVTAMGFPIDAATITRTAAEVGETSIISRTGGAPTLAVAMADIFSAMFGGPAMKAFWYHFAILFEALFILTAVDAGTRAGRFMLQDLLGLMSPRFRDTSALVPGLIATGLTVSAWGWFLYQGVTDPLGGVNTLWPLFGISNQMLAAIALMLGTVVLFRMKKQRYGWVTALPAAWLVICTMSAGWLKLFSADPKVGFLSHADLFSAAMARGELLAPAKTVGQMQAIVLNDRVDAALCAIFIVLVVAMLFYTVRACRDALGQPRPTTKEVFA
ncbi:carbon starvation CstA family protein [Polymorphobacter sp.]|uniref:carbon starvation CstA family protein n=1 Tax=Polymorphobacter sp. TaxID=1909290 RepID=UPI003F713F3D